MFELSALGFDAFFEAQFNDRSNPESCPARVASEHRDRYEVWSAEGVHQAILAGRLRLDADDTQTPRTGDWVVLASPPAAGEPVIIERVLQRKTVFTRGAAGPEARGQVIAANVDVVFVVSGLDRDYNPRRIERYLARVWASGAQPAVVLNKSDVCDTTGERIAEVMAHCPGVPVIATSAVHAAGLDGLRALIQPGKTAALVGSSGAGKSTLINALAGEEKMSTGEVRADDQRGRHTTTRRQLVLLPGGGLLLDTPGMRELQLLDEEGLSAVFADIEEYGTRCRYRDCRHEHEPGCAVIAAAEAGELPAGRYEHYRKLMREAHASELRHNALLRKKEARLWKNLDREGDLIRRKKEGR